jgi:steroid delta-isomerase-like uncharacterized protein
MIRHGIRYVNLSCLLVLALAASSCSHATRPDQPQTNGGNSKMQNESMLAVVRQFYDLLNHAADGDADERTARFMAEDWVSTPTPFGGPGRAGMVVSVKGYGQLIPDLKWDVKEMLVDGSRVIVRSVATGTPKGPFLGVDPPTGQSFEIMTIDIHTVEDGKIVRSFHLEDWAAAIQQLTRK